MRKIGLTSNDYEMFHNHNLYVPNRSIYFGGQGEDADVVTSNTIAQLMKNLHILEHKEIAPISILLNTVGGSWEDGIAVYDMIRALKSEVTIIGLGKVYSMGSIILQAGDHRVLTENTYLMIHDGSEGYEGDPKMIERWMEVSKAIRMKMYDIYWRRMKKKNKKLKLFEVEKICAIDTLYSAIEAVNVGLADEIIQGVSK